MIPDSNHTKWFIYIPWYRKYLCFIGLHRFIPLVYRNMNLYEGKPGEIIFINDVECVFCKKKARTI